jgi:formate/nitrite transporter FocA (FNT family)
VPALQPEQIYERTREEGRRRLGRPLLQLAATGLVGGFDVAFGVAAYALTAASLAPRAGEDVAHLGGAVAFGAIAFVFVVVGRSELFTENFLVPITGLSRDRGSWYKLGELWVLTLVMNLAGGSVLAVILTSHGVLRAGAPDELSRLANHVDDYPTLTSFLSAIAAGGLMTLMTWFVEGAADSMGLRVVMAWLVGALIVLGSFNHAIVSTIEFVFAMRYGGPISWSGLFRNLGLSVGGNLVGGLLLVTFVRSAQAFGVSRA